MINTSSSTHTAPLFGAEGLRKLRATPGTSAQPVLYPGAENAVVEYLKPLQISGALPFTVHEDRDGTAWIIEVPDPRSTKPFQALKPVPPPEETVALAGERQADIALYLQAFPQPIPFFSRFEIATLQAVAAGRVEDLIPVQLVCLEYILEKKLPEGSPLFNAARFVLAQQSVALATGASGASDSFEPSSRPAFTNKVGELDYFRVDTDRPGGAGRWPAVRRRPDGES